MTDANTTGYYRRREEHERGLAAAAIKPDIAVIHRELADRHQQLATSITPRHPG